MKKFVSFAIPILLIISSALVLFFFRTLPVSRTWKQFRVLYVESNASENEILSSCSKAGIQDIISLSNQGIIPGNESMTKYLSSILSFNQEFEKSRNSFFTDSTGSYRLFYIPLEYENLIPIAMKNVNYVWGTDENTALPILPSIISLVCAILFVCFAKYHFKQFLFSVPIIWYTVCFPFYTSTIVAVLVLYLFLLIQKLLKREGTTSSVLKNVYLVFLISISTLFIISCGLKLSLMFVLTLISSVSILFLTHQINIEKDKNAFFLSKKILKAKNIPIATTKNIRLLFVPLFAIILCIIFYFFGGKINVEKDKEHLSIPSPKEYNDLSFSADSYEEIKAKHTVNNLSDLTTWISDSWKTIRFMYTSLFTKEDSSREPKAGDVISIPSYQLSESGNGYITNYSQQITVLDDDFIAHSIAGMSEKPNSVEWLLASQNGFVSVSYKAISSNSENGDSYLIIKLLFIFLMISPIVITNEFKKKGK